MFDAVARSLLVRRETRESRHRLRVCREAPLIWDVRVRRLPPYTTCQSVCLIACPSDCPSSVHKANGERKRPMWDELKKQTFPVRSVPELNTDKNKQGSGSQG